MTKTENAKCHYCQADAEAVKKEATTEDVEDANGYIIGERETVELLPICESCHEEHYDGTETYPALLPLA